jgi:DNA polymerase-3 subunit delta'
LAVTSLARVAGHRQQVALLARAIARGTVPPTQLFAGPAGVGKFAVARSAAAAINCLTPVRDANGLAADACTTCRSCERIARGVHVDVLAVEPDDRDSIKIDVVRELLSRTGFRPFEGRRRVVLIRDAEALEVAAQNALLKSLEEPPPATVFMLTTAVPSALLPTVLSRCMRLRFGRLPEHEVEAILVRDFEFATAEARAAAALAGGSVGQALALASNDLAVLRDTALMLLGRAGAPTAARLQAAAQLVGKDRERGEVALILRMAASLVRDIELLNAGADPDILANAGVADDLRRLQAKYTGARAREAFAVIDRGAIALGRPHFAGPKVVSEWVAMQI